MKFCRRVPYPVNSPQSRQYRDIRFQIQIIIRHSVIPAWFSVISQRVQRRVGKMRFEWTIRHFVIGFWIFLCTVHKNTYIVSWMIHWNFAGVQNTLWSIAWIFEIAVGSLHCRQRILHIQIYRSLPLERQHRIDCLDGEVRSLSCLDFKVTT